jgi:enterochelin esterase-like enzyme
MTGIKYEKTASVYVPASYDGSEPMNILYLLHGSTGSGTQLGEAMQPLFDSWIQDGETKPVLVVFPTYYPDSSFVTSDYTQDYPLNHFFAQSRLHRAFGGYSMGGVTTWDVLAQNPQYFAYYLPMAGDCWLNRVTDADSEEETADLLAAGLQDHGLTGKDFRVIAMVGGNDGTRYSMQPQLQALRENHADFFTEDSLVYWENKGGGHDQNSLELEVEHGMRYLWNIGR